MLFSDVLWWIRIIRFVFVIRLKSSVFVNGFSMLKLI